MHAPAGSARELPCRFGRAFDHRCDLVEGHGEHVVEDERETLRGVECLEHHEKRQAHGVGEHDRVARVDGLAGHDRIGHSRLEGLLAPRAPRAQHVEAHAGRDGGQPPIGVVDARRARLAHPQPGLLERVVCLARRAEHPIRDGPETRPLLLEPLDHEVVLIHQSHDPAAR